MFLIPPPPNTKSPPDQTVPSRQETPEVPVRVKKACDRCRMKKIKCDGRKPCGRCTRDRIQCVQSRRVTTDAKALSRDYISSLEAQQAHLLDALWQLCLRAPSSHDQDVQKIIERLKMHDIDLDGLNTQRVKDQRPQPELPSSSLGASEAPGAVNEIDANGTDNLFTMSTEKAVKDPLSSVNIALDNSQMETAATIPNTWEFGCVAEQGDDPFVFAPPSNGAHSNPLGVDSPNFADQWWQSWMDVTEELSSTNRLNDIVDSDWSINCDEFGATS